MTSPRRTARLLLIARFAFPLAAAASTGGPSMPWDSGLQALVENLTGTLAHWIILGALCIGGIMWALTEHQVGMKRLSMALLGGGLAVAAVDVATTLGILGAMV